MANRNASARASSDREASPRIRSSSASALVMQPELGGQYFARSLLCAPRGRSMKCQGPVSGRARRTSSAQVEASRNRSPTSGQYRVRWESVGARARSSTVIRWARSLRCCSAMRATIWWPWHPQASAMGAVARPAKARSTIARRHRRKMTNRKWQPTGYPISRSQFPPPDHPPARPQNYSGLRLGTRAETTGTIQTA